MSIKQTIRTMVAAVFMIPVVAFATASPAIAAECGNVQTSVISCDETGDGKNIKDSGLWGILIMAINILSVGVGVLALAGIVYGSILYTSAGGSPDQIKKAKGVFTNVAIGVISFALMFSVLNFIIPGGIFN